MNIPESSRTGRESEPGAGNHVPAAVPGEGYAAGIEVPDASAREATVRAEGARGPSRAGSPLPARDGAARTYTIALPAGLQLLSLNGREHWAERARRAKVLKQAAWVMALQAKVPRLERVSVVVEYQPPDRRHRDADNAGTASGKHCIDGLVAAKVLEDDESPRYVTEVTYRIGKPYPLGRLVLYLTEVGEAA